MLSTYKQNDLGSVFTETKNCKNKTENYFVTTNQTKPSCRTSYFVGPAVAFPLGLLYHQRKEKRRKEKNLLVCTQSQIRITAVAMKPKRTASHRKSACSLCRSL